MEIRILTEETKDKNSLAINIDPSTKVLDVLSVLDCVRAKILEDTSNILQGDLSNDVFFEELRISDLV